MADGDVGTAVIAERLLQVIDEGRRTATYKLALLLALIDACAANADPTGRAPAELHTREIARHVLRRYLPHVRGYLAFDASDPIVLRQITTRNSAVLGAVLRLHLVGQEYGHRDFRGLETAHPTEFARCLDEVEKTFARYPVRLLQVVGSEYRPFLYDIDWSEHVSLASLHAAGGGLVQFRPGASDELVRLAPLVRPLIELHWVRMVAAINELDVEGERLRGHLFGVDRTGFPPGVRSGLRELQDGCCFYCGARLTNRSEIDHFVPWSRWPNDAIENLVLADACNNHKRDHLAASEHAAHWGSRLRRSSGDLAAVAHANSWPSEPARSLSIGRATYFHLPAGTPLWRHSGEFVDEDPQAIALELDPAG